MRREHSKHGRRGLVLAAFTVFIWAAAPFEMSGQWTCGSGLCSTPGNVAVGTTTVPGGEPLTVGGNVAVSGSVLAGYGGPPATNVAELEVMNYGAGDWFAFGTTGNANGLSSILHWLPSNQAVNYIYNSEEWPMFIGFGTAANQYVEFQTNQTSFMNGNVGIGTATPAHLLHVAGTIGAEEVIVSSTGADYVFDPGYRLRPLDEVATYVAANHHLPDVPSAAEMKQNGVGLADMQTKLLAKIEELTLHMIAAERENAELRARVAGLEAHREAAGIR